MTRADHQSGTERLAEVVEKCAFSDDTIIVNIQGDEPMIPGDYPPGGESGASSSGMATLAVPIHDAEEAFNPNGESGDGCQGLRALFLPRDHSVGSRSLCPIPRDHR
jgi:CMP-2-keto-3-deoxyoctulosonic acid synthetase